MKQGLREYVLVSAFLALAAAGAVAIFGEELRGALGVDRPAAPARAAPPAAATSPARPAAPPSARPAAPASRAP